MDALRDVAPGARAACGRKTKEAGQAKAWRPNGTPIVQSPHSRVRRLGCRAGHLAFARPGVLAVGSLHIDIVLYLVHGRALRLFGLILYASEDTQTHFVPFRMRPHQDV